MLLNELICFDEKLFTEHLHLTNVSFECGNDLGEYLESGTFEVKPVLQDSYLHICFSAETVNPDLPKAVITETFAAGARIGKHNYSVKFIDGRTDFRSPRGSSRTHAVTILNGVFVFNGEAK